MRGCGGSTWSAASRLAFDDDYDAVLTVQARRDRLDAAIAAMAADSEFTRWCTGWGACAGSRP